MAPLSLAVMLGLPVGLHLLRTLARPEVKAFFETKAREKKAAKAAAVETSKQGGRTPLISARVALRLMTFTFPGGVHTASKPLLFLHSMGGAGA